MLSAGTYRLSSPLLDLRFLNRRITNATALYSSLLGIRSAYALGSPPTEMIIEYERTEGDSRTLSIKFGRDGKMRDAEVSVLGNSQPWLAMLGSRLRAVLTSLVSLSVPSSYHNSSYTPTLTSRTSYRPTCRRKTFAPSSRRFAP